MEQRSENSSRKPRWRLTTVVLIVLSFVTLTGFATICVSGVFAEYHAGVLRSLGAEVNYGVKGGYFVTTKSKANLSRFINDGRRSLDYLSRNYSLTIRLDGSEVTDQDLLVLDKISGPFYLSVRNTAITDAALTQLLPVANLKGIDAENSKITSTGLASFNRLRTQ